MGTGLPLAPGGAPSLKRGFFECQECFDFSRHKLAHEGGKVLSCLASRGAGHIGKIGNLELLLLGKRGKSLQ